MLLPTLSVNECAFNYLSFGIYWTLAKTQYSEDILLLSDTDSQLYVACDHNWKELRLVIAHLAIIMLSNSMLCTLWQIKHSLALSPYSTTFIQDM